MSATFIEGRATIKASQAIADAATSLLAGAINQHFPVGCDVVVSWGSGWMRGKVAHETRNDDVCVRSDQSGEVHWKHWTLVWRQEEPTDE